MLKENQILEQKEIRNEMIDKIEVLEKVGNLLLLPNTEFATTQQVAEYYCVAETTIKEQLQNNKDEFDKDGYNVLVKNELHDIKVLSGFKSRAKSLAIFPKRAILRMGMLLRDSEVAKEIRTRLLDIVHDAENGNGNIETVVNELNEEQQIMMERIQAEFNGDYDKVSLCNAKLFDLKNKRLKEVEAERDHLKVDIENITTHSLTIIDSRSVINKLIRKIACEKYQCSFGEAWNEFYQKLNYKLGININNRTKKKGQSKLSLLTDEETFKAEEIVRTWALNCNIDIQKELSLAN